MEVYFLTGREQARQMPQAPSSMTQKRVTASNRQKIRWVWCERTTNSVFMRMGRGGLFQLLDLEDGEQNL